MEGSQATFVAKRTGNLLSLLGPAGFYSISEPAFALRASELGCGFAILGAGSFRGNQPPMETSQAAFVASRIGNLASLLGPSGFRSIPELALALRARGLCFGFAILGLREKGQPKRHLPKTAKTARTLKIESLASLLGPSGFCSITELALALRARALCFGFAILGLREKG